MGGEETDRDSGGVAVFYDILGLPDGAVLDADSEAEGLVSDKGGGGAADVRSAVPVGCYVGPQK